jgi:hypothetical protein
MMRFSLALLAVCFVSATAQQTLDWSFDQFTNPFVGEHTGCIAYDINHDGLQDLLFAAVRFCGIS